ncbi:MAG: ABC transporter ATP-binding protein [Candidatus Lambdaproteobacteria bacterium]|nr:ABC transporter ATP-binding protein [Candidatus Lambdaproteobacteria bacterium]
MAYDSSMQQPAIEAIKLVKRFGEVTAVDGVSFTVRRGSITALLGGNGAGKTTTLSIMLGLLLPTSGEARILGESLVHYRQRILPRVNFSSPYVDLPQRLTVRQNLRVYGMLYGVRGLGEKIVRLAHDLELDDLLERPHRELSAGQKTRVALAKALINDPDVLFMDEPTASLDPDMADYARSLLQAYQARTGATILMASHNMTEVERICDDVLMMRRGRIVDQGSPRELLARYGRKTMEEVFLDIARERHAHPFGQSGAEAGS